MSKARDLADLLDANGDVDAGALDNVPAADVVNDTTPQLGGDLQSNGNDVVFADNDKAIFGAGSDLQIYHDAGNSRIVDAGTGNLNLQADNNINILNNAGTEFKAQFITNGAVNLFYDNANKFATTSTGVSVTGTVTATSFSGDGSGLTGISAIASSANSVGSYITARRTGSTQLPGATYSGSDMYYSNSGGTILNSASGKPSGTWRLHGRLNSANNEQATTLFQRIS